MIIQVVVASGLNKSFAASGCSRSLAGPLGQLDILCWPFGPAINISLAHHKISSWPRGPAKDLEQPEAAYDLLWPEATTS